MKLSNMPPKNTNPSVSCMASSMISSSIPFSVTSSAPITPFASALPAGVYESVLLRVSDAMQNGVCVGVDCIHELTAPDEKHYTVRFRVYAPHEFDALLSQFASYGIKGNLDKATIGLKEEVEIAPKGTGVYVGIVHRTLKQLPTASAAAKPSIGSRSKASVKTSSGRKVLLDDEDDDFEDILEDDDDEI